MKKVLLIMAMVMFVAAPAFAFSVVLDPDNGHSYQAVSGQYDWNVAATLAEGSGGYLATLTSQVENDWVWDNVIASSHPSWYLLGGFQSPVDQGIANNWHWVTAEAWGYDNWNGGEPNDGDNSHGFNEDVLQYWNNGQWNDVSSNSNNSRYGGPTYYQGYIVEFDPATNVVPEPASMSLLGLGLLGLVRRYRRK